MNEISLETLTDLFDQFENTAEQKQCAALLLDHLGLNRLDDYLELTHHATSAYAALIERLDEPRPCDPDALETLDWVMDLMDCDPKTGLYSFNNPLEHRLWQHREESLARQHPVPVSAICWHRGCQLAARGRWEAAGSSMEWALRWDPASAPICLACARCTTDPRRKETMLKAAIYNALNSRDLGQAYQELSLLYGQDTALAAACALTAMLYDPDIPVSGPLLAADPDGLPTLTEIQQELRARGLPFYVPTDKTSALLAIWQEDPALRDSLEPVIANLYPMMRPDAQKQFAELLEEADTD